MIGWLAQMRMFKQGMHPSLFLAGWVLATVQCLSGCASSADISIQGEAAAVINRDYTGKSLSVAVRVYQLKSDQLFSRLTYESLTTTKGEQALLGGDLIGIKDMLVLPGGTVSLDGLKLDEETRFVALVGFFRQPDRAYWRLLFPAERVKGKRVFFKVEDCYLLPVQPPVKALPDQLRGGSPSCSR